MAARERSQAGDPGHEVGPDVEVVGEVVDVDRREADMSAGWLFLLRSRVTHIISAMKVP